MDRYLKIWKPILRKFEETYTRVYGPDKLNSVRIIDWYPSGYAEIVVKMSDNMTFAFNRIGCCLTPIKNEVGIADDNDGISENEELWRKNFSRRLLIKMRRNAFTQAKLSRLTGITQLTLTKYINGKTTPSGYNLERLSRALGCTVSELTSAYYKEEELDD